VIDDAAVRLKIRTDRFRPRRRTGSTWLAALLAWLALRQQRILHALIVAIAGAAAAAG